MKVAVLSPSFSKNKILQKEIYKYFPDTVLNLNGVKFSQIELIEYIKNADAIIVGLDQINLDVLNKCPNLKIIAKYGVGLNNIDLEACRERNIDIGWISINKLSVAEMHLVLC